MSIDPRRAEEMLRWCSKTDAIDWDYSQIKDAMALGAAALELAEAVDEAYAVDAGEDFHKKLANYRAIKEAVK